MTKPRPNNVYEFFLKIPQSAILPGEAAPDHYTLLSLPHFTNDAVVIKEVAIARNTELRGWDNSDYHLWSNELLDEVVIAIQTLEDPGKKAAYDAGLRQRLGLPEVQPVAESASAVVVEGPPESDPFDGLDGEPLPELPARRSKKSATERTGRGKATTRAEADDPEKNFQVLFLKLGGGVIAVALLIAVPVVMWTWRKSAPVASPNQTVATVDTSETSQPAPKPAPDPDWDPANVRELATLSHSDEVVSVAFSPDGKRLAAASNSRIRVWDVTSGQGTLWLQGHSRQVYSVVFSPDGKWLASASGDGTVKIWDATNGQETLTFRGHKSLVFSVAFSPDGKRLASAAPDYFGTAEVIVWDAMSGGVSLKLKGDSMVVRSVAFSPDGKRVASDLGNRAVKICDATSGEVLLTLEMDSEFASHLAFSPDGTRLVGGGRIWDATSGEVIGGVPGYLSPDGKRLASGGYQGDVWVSDATTQKVLLTLKGHTRPVRSVAFSPDGKRLASVSEDKTVKIWGAELAKSGISVSPASPKLTETPKPAPDPNWDPANVRELVTLTGHSGLVRSVAFSADGKRLASASDDRTVKVWDATSGREALTLKGHTGPIASVAFSEDGQRLVSASGDNTVKVWDATSGEETLTLKGHTSGVESVAFSADGERLASAGHDGAVKVWDATSGLETLTLKGHTRSVMSVVFSADGKRLASGSLDWTVKVWDAMTGQETLTMKGDIIEIGSVAFSPDGKRLASAGGYGVKVWDATSGQEMLTLKGHNGVVYDVVFSSDGKRLASASEDRTVKVWDATSGQETLTLKGHTELVYGVALSADGKRLASASFDKTVKIWGTDRANAEPAESPASPKLMETPKPAPDSDWDPANVRELATLRHTGLVYDVAFSADGKRLAAASVDGTVKVWDATSSQEMLTLKGHNGRVRSVAFSPDEKRLASASEDGTVKVWDAISGEETFTLQENNSALLSVVFSPDGKRLASASTDRTVKVWDATNGQETRTLKVKNSFAKKTTNRNTTSGQVVLTLKGHTSIVNSVAFSADGKRLASASDDQTVKVWDATSGQEMLTLKGHINRVRSVAFSADGTRLASAGGAWAQPGELKVWDVTSGQETLTLKGHTNVVLGVAFSPDGKRLASASDNTVKVWDATSGQATLTLKGHTGQVNSVAFSSDGKRLASAGFDETVKIWGAGRDATDLKPSASSLANVPRPPTTNPNASAPATGSMTATKPITSKSTGMPLSLIPQGTFTMGSPKTEKDRSNSEGPQHEVQISKPFYLGIYEVTQAEFQQVLGRNPSLFATVDNRKTERFPVERVSWFDAIEFCNKLSVLDELTPQYELTEIQQPPRGPITSAVVRSVDGTGYRLPTEAEWEYACRANTVTPFHHGVRLNGREANVDGTSPYGTKIKGAFLQRPTTVGPYSSNEFGLFDMHGNVWEWCQDVYDANVYSSRGTAAVDPVITDSPNSPGAVNRVVRGGSWKNAAVQARSAFRHSFAPHDAQSSGIVGFRVACPASGASAVP